MVSYSGTPGFIPSFPTVDGRNPAPPKKPWNHDSLVNTKKPTVSHGFQVVRNGFFPSEQEKGARVIPGGAKVLELFMQNQLVRRLAMNSNELGAVEIPNFGAGVLLLQLFTLLLSFVCLLVVFALFAEMGGGSREWFFLFHAKLCFFVCFSFEVDTKGVVRGAWKGGGGRSLGYSWISLEGSLRTG